MRMRKLGIASTLAAAALLVGCSDASMLSDGRGVDSRRTQSPTDPADAQAEGGPNDDGGSLDGGAADGDAAAPGADAAPIASAFTGASVFTPAVGPSARNAAHVFATNTPPTSAAKQACLDCHKAGGTGLPFLFGGTAYKDVAGVVPAAGVEIRLRAPDGLAVSAYTDEDGNFYRAATPTSPKFPVSVGVRNATGTRLMAGAPPDGNCSTALCHGGTHPWVYLP